MKRICILLALTVVTACAGKNDIIRTNVAEDRSLPGTIAYVGGWDESDATTVTNTEGKPLLDRGWSKDQNRFSFVVIGDKTGGGYENWPIFDKAIEEVNRLRPAFAIMVGDLIQGYHSDTVKAAAEWEEFWSHAGKLEVPFFAFPGNHDVTTPELMDYWGRHIGPYYYSFDYLGAHFLVLNTEQERFSGVWGFGDAQMRFALDDIARNAGARHTFILMHKPGWLNELYTAEWARIEAALGDRDYTVFAGHRHNLSYEVHNGRRHFVVGPTGAGTRESAVRELGAFHHFTWVTVEDDSVHIAIVEPGGPIWPEDIATAEFKQNARRLVRFAPRVPTESPPGTLNPTLDVHFQNLLPDTAAVTLTFPDLTDPTVEHTGWTLVDTIDSVHVVLPPSSRESVTVRFQTPTDRLHRVPQAQVATSYRGVPMFARTSPMPVFPEAAIRRVEEWRVIGPFANTDNRERFTYTPSAEPLLRDILGPDGMFDPEASVELPFSDDAQPEVAQWELIESNARGNVDLGAFYRTTERAVAYLTVGIESPNARKVWAVMWNDDYARVMLNGEMIRGGRVFSGDQRGPDYIALDLREGTNVLVVKAVNTGNAWSTSFRIVDPDSALTFTTEPSISR